MNDFTKKNDILICLDSDGCVMDTMEYKHRHIFGPLILKYWDIKEEKIFLEVWNEMNLYTRTRGINRFFGLVTAFRIMREKGFDMPALIDFENWLNQAEVVSNDEIKKTFDKTKSRDLEKVLLWSYEVNQKVKEISESFKSFKGVEEPLKKLSSHADIAIVSSANTQAIVDEWGENNLLKYTDIVMGQEKGTKQECIEALVQKGYERENIIFLGDAPSDLSTSIVCGVKFYPILAGVEELSWRKFDLEVVPTILNKNYTSDIQKKYVDEFKTLLRLN